MKMSLREYSDQLHREIAQGLGSGYGPETPRRSAQSLEDLRPGDRFAQFRESRPAVIVDLSKGAVRAWEEAKAERAARLAAEEAGNDGRKEERPYGLSEELLTLTDEDMEAIRSSGGGKKESSGTASGTGGKDEGGDSEIDQLKEEIKEAEQRLQEAQEELARATREAQGADNASGAGAEAGVRAAQDKVSAAQSELQQLNAQLGAMQSAG